MISGSAPVAEGRFRTLLDRMVKSARLSGDTFLSLKEDPTATSQALTVLALAGASFGVGFAASIVYSIIGIILGAVIGAIVGIGLGFAWLSLTFLIGTRVFHGTSDYWSLARPVFFATSPGLVFLLALVPVVADIARAIGIAWIAISTVIAVKTALGLDNQRSLAIFIMVTFIILISYGLIASL